MGDLVPVADMALPEVHAELTDLRGLMGDRSSVYWKDPAMQTRARQLYEARDGSSAPADDEDQDFIVAEMRPVGLQEFNRANPDIDFAEYLGVLRNATDVVQGVPETEQADLIASFNGLPDGVIAAIAGELTSTRGTGFAYASAEQVSKFATEQGGHVLREWGDDCAVTMARVMARLNRCMNDMSESEEASFVAWHESLTGGQRAAIYRKLAA